MKFKKLIISTITALTFIGLSTSVINNNVANAADNSDAIEVEATAKQDQITRLDDIEDVTVAVSPSLSNQVKSAIAYSMQQWNSTGIANLSYYQGRNPEDATIYVTNSNPANNTWGSSMNLMYDTETSNVKELVTTRISLDSGLRHNQYNDADVAHTVMHEMGHGLGLDDNYADPNAIMYYTSDYESGTDPTVKLNASDYQNLRQLYYPAYEF